MFIYLREIGPVLAAAARVLAPGGLFAFTIQGHPVETARARADGRYAHGVATLREAAEAAGLAIALLEPAEIRRQNGGGRAGVAGGVGALRLTGRSVGNHTEQNTSVQARLQPLPTHDLILRCD